MKRRHHTPEQVIRKLAEGEKLLNAGHDVAEVCRQLEITESTWHRWRNQYGGMKANDAKRLKELENENRRLKRIVADQALDNDMLRHIAEGKFGSPAIHMGRTGRWPERLSRASAIRALTLWKPNARRAINRIFVLTDSTRALERPSRIVATMAP